jgi:hypothetical protein
MKTFLPLFALCFAAFGSIPPLIQLIDLWQAPMGSGIRPMAAPIIFLIFGCGTPVLVVGLALYIFKKSKEVGLLFREVMAARTIACIAGILSLLPAFLSTYGLYWVIETRHLWMEP